LETTTFFSNINEGAAMKIQFLHDSAGNIRGVFAPAANRKGQLRPQGHDRVVTEIDVPELAMEVTPKNHDQLVRAVNQFITECTVISGRLVRRGKEEY
jgi:hypothetical protein